jgi:hypothetical protein
VLVFLFIRELSFIFLSECIKVFYFYRRVEQVLSGTECWGKMWGKGVAGKHGANTVYISWKVKDIRNR